MRIIKWFSVSFGLAFGTTAGLAVSAAPGDAIINLSQPDKVITQQQFRTLAQLAVNFGAWDGTADTVTRFCPQYINDHYEISDLHALEVVSSEDAIKRVPGYRGVVE